MHPGSLVFVGYARFEDETTFPEGKFGEEFLELFEGPRVLTPDGDPIDFELDGDDLPAGNSDVKYFRSIGTEDDAYGFQIASFDTVAEVDLTDLLRKAERWMPIAQKIADRYHLKSPKVYVLSELA